MQFTRPRQAAIGLALMLALALPGSALAAESSSGVSESFSILASVELSNVPASATWAQGPGCGSGCLPTDYAYIVTPFIATNNATGATLTANATALVNGGGTIPLSARGISVGGDAGAWDSVTPGGANIGVFTGPAVTLGSLTSNASASVGMEPLFRYDTSGLPAGSYASTFTLTLTSNP